jgi:hypothetical protein
MKAFSVRFLISSKVSKAKALLHDKGRVAIVTGASSGMGEALSKDLVNKGWKVSHTHIGSVTTARNATGCHGRYPTQ